MCRPGPEACTAAMPVSVLLVGAGEYICGYVPTVHGAASDKPAGVVAITCFDLRRLGQVSKRPAAYTEP